MKVISLSSGNEGNCFYVEAEQTRILVDAGLPLEKIEEKLKNIGVDPIKINAVVITNIEITHVRGLKEFVDLYKAKAFVYYSEWFDLEEKIGDVDDFYQTNYFDGPFRVRDLEIVPFETTHLIKCFGFTIKARDSEISLIPDIGEFNDTVMQNVRNSSFVGLSCCYDLKSLANMQDKRKMLAIRDGHLSNKACAKAVVKMAKEGIKNFALLHLHSESNKPELALKTVNDALKEAGFSPETDVFVKTAEKDRIKELI